MVKKTIHFIILLISGAWMYLSLVSIYQPFAPLTKLFSYPQGAFFSHSPKDQIEFTQSACNARISLDEFGIPTIEGKTANDVAFAMGFMHARDRYFQMELITRTVEGNLSEILGEQTLNNDLFWKPMEIEAIAKKQMQHLKKDDPKMYHYLMHYNKGVNFYLNNEKQSERFTEYALINENPRKWQDHYPMLLSFYMSYMLAYDDSDLAWANELEKMPEDLRQLFYEDDTLNYPYVHPGSFESKNVSKQLAVNGSFQNMKAYDAVKMDKNLTKGSNNWVIAGSKSKSGKAILANDTHLDILMPNPWYQAQLICPEFHVQGFTIPCMPYVLSGNNEFISWGITNAHWDQVDLFKMKLTADKKGYILDGKTEKIEIKKHAVKIKGADDHVFESKHSKQGLIHEIQGQCIAEYWYPLYFTEVNKAFKKLETAKNLSDFKAALSKHTFPPQNFVYSDAQGNIGMISAGMMPARDKSHRGELLDGSVSFPKKMIEFSSLPQTYNPERAFLGSANQNPAQSNYYVNHYFADKTRGLRIEDILSKSKDIDLQKMQEIQTDKVDLLALETISLFGKLKLNSKQKAFLDKLKNWDGKMDASKHEPVIHHLLQQGIKRNIGHFLTDNFKSTWNPSMANVIKVLKNETFTISSKVYKSSDFLVASIDSAMLWYGQNGNDKQNFAAFSGFSMNHILQIPGLGRVIPDKGGTNYTLDVNGYGQHGASMRLLVEMSKIPMIKTILAGGQSGRIFSPHYADQVMLWNKGNYHDIHFGKPAKKSSSIITFKN